MGRLLDFYATQIRVLREWQGGPVSLLKRLIITLVVATVSFLATAAILSDRMTIDRPRDAALAVILMALFNAAIRPVVLVFAAQISLVLTGVLVLVLQVVAFLVVAQWAPGVHVDGFVVALIGSFIYAIINTVLTSILGVDSGGSYYGLLVQRLLVKSVEGTFGSARARHHPDRWSGAPDPRRPDPCRLGQHAGQLDPGRNAQAVALGGDPAVHDLGEPGRHPARQQRRDPGIPLV